MWVMGTWIILAVNNMLLSISLSPIIFLAEVWGAFLSQLKMHLQMQYTRNAPGTLLLRFPLGGVGVKLDNISTKSAYCLWFFSLLIKHCEQETNLMWKQWQYTMWQHQCVLELNNQKTYFFLPVLSLKTCLNTNFCYILNDMTSQM